jgi:ABC-type tungstate transport system substrate-binding protein
MKEKLIREARIAQAAAIRAAFARLIAAIVACAARLSPPPYLPSPEPEHGD